MKNTLRLLIATAVALLCAGTARGAGLAILEQSIPGLGRSMAGMTASYDDPSGLYYNPAAAAWADHPIVMSGIHLLTGRVEFERRSHGECSPGRGSGDIVGKTLIPNLDLTLPIADTGVNFNMAMSATSGTSVHYHRNWAGRYMAIDNDVAVVELQPSLSWRVTDEIAIAAGLIVDYCKVKMYQALPTAPYGHDSHMRADGNDWSFGFTAGAVWRPTDKTTLGLGYRSKSRSNLHMRVKYKHMPEIMGMGNRVIDWADMSIDMPQAINFGVRQDLTEAWSLMSDIAWTQWSCMKELKMKFDKGFAGTKVSSDRMKWHDSWRFALGTEYKLNEKWTLRCGSAFDQRVVKQETDKSCKLPDSHRIWISIGASYQWNEHLRLDAAFCHLFFHRSKIDQINEASGTRIQGKYHGFTDLASIGLRYDF